MPKTSVYSWRLSPNVKQALEREARRARLSLADLLDRIATSWLEARRQENATDEDEQAALQASVARHVGTLTGRDPRASENVGAVVRARVRKRRAG